MVGCRLFAVVAWLTHAIYKRRDIRMERYFDDPAAAVSGPHRFRHRALAAIIMAWRRPHLELACQKGHVGRRVDWIGSTLTNHTATVPSTRVSLVKPWTRCLDECCDEPMEWLPILPEHMAEVGALMHVKGHRSFSNYISMAREEHACSGCMWARLHELDAKQVIRSATRRCVPPAVGQGRVHEPCQRHRLRLRLHARGDRVRVRLPGTLDRRRAAPPGGTSRLGHQPRHTGNRVLKSLDMYVYARWFGRAVHVPHRDAAHRLAGHHLRLHARAQRLPPFSRRVSKEAVVATIEKIALTLRSYSGGKLFGGQAMRVSGARWLARSGVRALQIQTLARWISRIVLRCIAQAHIEEIGAFMGPLSSAVEPTVVKDTSWGDDDSQRQQQAHGEAVEHLKGQIIEVHS